MKKLLFLITSILAVSTACIAAGCHGNQGGPDATNERTYNVEQQDDENQPSENDDDCKNGGCKNKNLPEGMPEFKFRPRRPNTPQGDNKQERETENDGDGIEDPIGGGVEPVRPHKARPHKNNPTPRPMPVRPKK